MNRVWQATVYCLIVLAALYLSACSSQAPRDSADNSGKANEVLFTALGMVGVPYRYGGNTPAGGFDCSGLIRYVYAVSADVALPRTVAEMNRLNAPSVKEENLQAGDLVIFATGFGSRPSHAGIFVGDGRFVHAPSSGGAVRMDFLSDDYWQRSYLTAKRPLAIR